MWIYVIAIESWHRVEMCGKRWCIHLPDRRNAQTHSNTQQIEWVHETNNTMIADNNNSNLKYDMNVYDNAFKRPFSETLTVRLAKSHSLLNKRSA